MTWEPTATAVDDHSRVAYAEIHNDETAITAVGVLQRAVSWFAARGITVERVLSDNGSSDTGLPKSWEPWVMATS